MGVLYRAIKRTWRALAPQSAKAFSGRSRTSRVILAVKRRLEQTATHNELYDATYFSRGLGGKDAYAAGLVAATRRLLPVTSVIDVGCGSGSVLAEFQNKGLSCRGLEYSKAAIEICLAKNLDVLPFDLEDQSKSKPRWTSDMVISIEVAEHLPEFCADHYIDLMCGMASRFVIISAAPPGQGGTDHVNERPPGYWIEKFECRGWTFSKTLTQQFKTAPFDKSADPARIQNLLVFVKH